MSADELEGVEKAEKRARKKLSRKLEAVGWSLFFIWVGIVMITGAETPVAFLGIGIIILSVQATRRFLQLGMEKFWTIVGLLFLGGGLWKMFNFNAPFGAVVLILAGVVILVSTLRREGSEKPGIEDTSEEPSQEES